MVQVKSSKSFRTILSLVLSLGNYMNGGNASRGQADGYQLDILDKLDGTKESSGRLSLLDYTVRILADNFPHALECSVELNGRPSFFPFVTQRLTGSILFFLPTRSNSGCHSNPL